MTVFGICEKGNYRRQNQDSVLMRTRGSSGLLLVADGVGGSADGSAASFYIAETYARWWDEAFLENRNHDFFSLFEELKTRADEINGDLCRKYGPGRSCSTLALLFVHRGIYGYLSSGDSRIYRCNRKGARPITRDDVWENRPGADAGSDNAGKIISALGAYERLEYSCATDKVHMGEVFLLCSDGIYRFVEEDTLKSVLQRMYRSLFLTKGAVERLVKTAVDNDTKDNYSLIAVKI